MSAASVTTGTVLSAEARLRDLPRERLAILPSPLHEVPRLGAEIGGPALWIKRDDLLGFGLGGNKVRGLELLLADALAVGADTLVTGAGPQSNHVRATAAAAAVAGLAMVAVYFGREPSVAEGNLMVTRLFGGETRFTGDDDRTSVDRGIAQVSAELRSAGRAPYAIPRGGASALGVLGQVLAVVELAEQVLTLGLRPDRIILAVGSGGTLAGWLLGTRLFGLEWAIVGYSVSRPVDEAKDRVMTLATDAAAVLGVPLPPSFREAIDVRGGVIGDGYGIPSAAGIAALEQVARHEGIVLDETYTAKAFGGYLADVAAGGFKDVPTVVFLHTGGELPRTVGRG